MDIKEYQQKAERTVNSDLIYREQLSNLCMGLAGESGEVIDYIKNVYIMDINYINRILLRS